MKHKRFCLVMLAALVVVIAANFLIWKLWTEVLLTKKYDGGDLARLSYIHASKLYRKNAFDLPRRHELLDLGRRQKIDILTVGDSFSMGLGEGKNHYYQDYLATYSNASVANVSPYPTDDGVMGFSPLTNLLMLYNSGVLDEIKPKYVLLESVERYCVRRYSRDYNFAVTEPREKLVRFYHDKKYDLNYLPAVGFFNTGNFKFLWYNLLYRFSDRAFENHPATPVYRKLSKPLFSRNGDHILFVNEDQQNVPLATEANMEKLNDNLNRMAELLERKGIKLVFMPIVDKYDLYADYIVADPYPKSTFFEKLRPLPKKYLFVDTKALLKEEVDRGVLDVFYPDETHWSWKAAEKVFRATRLD